MSSSLFTLFSRDRMEYGQVQQLTRYFHIFSQRMNCEDRDLAPKVYH